MSKSKVKTKWLYRFNLQKTIMTEEDMTPVVGEGGEEIVQKKRVAKAVEFECALLKPSRKLFEDGELYYSVILSKYIQAGLLTKQLLAKRFQNDGGTISEDDKGHYAKQYSLLSQKEQQVKAIQIDIEMKHGEKSDKLHELFLDMATIRKQLVEFEGSQSSLFDQTADHKAKNKAIMWWVLMLSYWKDEGTEKLVPVFGDGTFEEREEIYDAIEDEVGEETTSKNAHFVDIIKYFSYYTAFWFSGQASDKASFDEAASLLGDLEAMDATSGGEETAGTVASVVAVREFSAKEEELKEMDAKEIEMQRVNHEKSLLEAKHLGDRGELEVLRGELEASAVDGSAEESPEKPTEESSEKPSEESPEKPAGESAEESPEKLAEESPEKPAEESPEKPAEESPEKPAEESPEKPAEESSEESTKTIPQEEDSNTSDDDETPLLAR
jgi:hypothetical protein